MINSLHVAVKLPFPLTIRFKSMLQSGVMTRDLDVRWVSSLSWYFLNLMGLQSVFGFILGSDNGMYQIQAHITSYASAVRGILANIKQPPTKWPSKWAWPTLQQW
jgi:hypothetical protein